MNALSACRLYGILDLGYVTPAHAPAALERMLEGGVDLVQLRAKKSPTDTIATLARQLAPMAKAAGVPFLLNDHPQIAGELGLDGTHVGQGDLTVHEARRLVGSGKIIGKSTHSVEQAVAAEAEGPDYIGFGPLFATPTKPDYTPIGTAEIKAVHERLSIPIFCIGGIKRENLDAVIHAGARRIVIVSGILQAPDIVAYCREVKQQLAGRPLF